MSGTPLPLEIRPDNIAVLSLTPNPTKPRGGVVVLDRWLIDSLDASLCAIAQRDLAGLVLKSASDRVFVAGADLAEIDALNDSDLELYLRAGSVAYGRISKLPFASAAVIHKSALGGGLEIALHCDGLIGAAPAPKEKGWKIGLPECGLGICPGWGGTMMLSARMDVDRAIMATCAGTPFDSLEVPSGLFATTFSTDESPIEVAAAWILANPRIHPRRSPISVADEQFHKATFEALERIEPHRPNSGASQAVVDAINTGLQHGFQAGVLCEQKHLIDLRHTPEARSRLEAFLKR